jgi:hypothetical protein
MGTVTLIDGTEVDSASEAWRAECEARHILSMRDIYSRREYLAAISKRRGDKAGNALADLVRAVWAHNRKP